MTIIVAAKEPVEVCQIDRGRRVLRASQFLTKQIFVGAVGYFYEQISPDSGSGDHVGAFESGVIGVGPQVGFILPLGEVQAYLNLKAYGEFAGHDRADFIVFAPAAIQPKIRNAYEMTIQNIGALMAARQNENSDTRLESSSKCRCVAPEVARRHRPSELNCN